MAALPSFLDHSDRPFGPNPKVFRSTFAPRLPPPGIPRREVRLEGADDDAKQESDAADADAADPRNQLRVLTWNVLADGLAQHGRWTHLPPGDASPALAWEQRFPRLLSEIVSARPDVVCLQECNNFREEWLPAMERLGYDGTVWTKPRSPCERYGADRDGLALFWRHGRLRPLLSDEEAAKQAAVEASPGWVVNAPPSPPPQEEGADGKCAVSAQQQPWQPKPPPLEVESCYYYAGPYRHLAPSPAALATVEEDGEGGSGAAAAGSSAAAAGDQPQHQQQQGTPHALQAASQGMIVAVLEECSFPQRRLVVAVTHLKAKEGFEARRREQAEQLCARVREMLARLSLFGGGGGNSAAAADAAAATAVVVAGDFNAAPDSSAAQFVRAPASAGGLGLRCIWDVPVLAPAAVKEETMEVEEVGVGVGVGSGHAQPQPQPVPRQGEDLLFTTWKFRGGGIGAICTACGCDRSAGKPDPPREKLETIDHVFFGSGGRGGGSGAAAAPAAAPLVPLARWATPSRAEIGPNALPCKAYPSDHVAVLCSFAWRRRRA
jgi:endonuclease/exonuclease/phosphatase family metal-dependent hydrolase